MAEEDVIDEEPRVGRKAKAASFDSDNASNSSPLLKEKKLKSMRHAATLAADNKKHGS